MAAYGHAIAERRKRFGFSIDEVAHLSGLTPTAVDAIESDSGRLTMLELEALGRALIFDPATLLRGESLPDARRLPGWFRSHTPDSSEAIPASDVRLMALAAELGEVGAFLQGLVGQPALSLAVLRSPVPLEDHEHAWREGYELGARARARLEELDSIARACEPLRSIQQILERIGIHVARVSMESWSRQAVSVWRPGAMPVVLLNECSGRVRWQLPRRQVMAHELPHLLHDGGETDLSPTERRPQPHAEALEQRANAFAPAFIAPPEYVRERVAKHSTPEQAVLQIAREWGFTLEGAVWHAKNVGIIDAETTEQLLANVAWRSRSTRIPGNWEPELPRDDPRDHGLDVEVSPIVSGLLQDLVLQAHRSGAISSGRAREILALS
ncbi:helix-turn-helix domain-containing protein [Paraliomyxa miuraensis]|uniref:helix-turn-helix domain-containing protein n=1 Tax=Paraliomyxa miuraensis TaxID=376150 RepID=UPI002253FD18|nr:XRE family transcriptional regulator [Paraliomyxa miuraensis]MCX4244751.1 XRE family transcriptional regulator [Paraliomyxa miuraensis]